MLPLLLICFIVSTSVAVPAPTIVFTAPAQPVFQPLTATCPPTVVSNRSAFVCYTNGMTGNETVQYVNPSNPATNGVPASFKANARFVFPPIALSQLTAIAYASSPNSSFYAMFSSVSASLTYVDRRNDTANVVYAPDIHFAFVPIGITPRLGWYDTIIAMNVNAATAQEALVWSLDFVVPPNYPYSTRMATPVYYNGFLYVTTRDHFFQINATTGVITKNVSDPCNLQLSNSAWLNFQVVTVGQDANGPLDAFILAANTSTATVPQFSVCRISHITFQQEWREDIEDDLIMQDITGGRNTIVCSGQLTQAALSSAFVVFTLDATAGLLSDVLSRSPGDQFSFPAVLPQPVGGCQETLVFQVDGFLTAFCTTDLLSPVWVANYPCFYRPTVDAASNSVVCTTWQQSVQRIDSDGSVIWLLTGLQPVFTASIVGGLVYFVDNHATLYGVSLQPNVPPVPPLPTILYENYAPQGANYLASCPLTVASLSGAFVCYSDESNRNTVRYLNPSNPSLNGPPSTFNSTAQFLFPPIAVTNSTAITFTNAVASSQYVLFSATHPTNVVARNGDTAIGTYAPDLGISFVPIGVVNDGTLHDSIEAYRINAITGGQTKIWTLNLPAPNGYRYTTTISNPVYYNGAVYVASRSHFMSINPHTGVVVANYTNPCQMNVSSQPLSLQVVTYGNNLDAFIIAANTSSPSNGPMVSFCRISHLTGAQEWRIDYHDDLIINDITGANGVVIVSGQLTELPLADSYVLFAINAANGLHSATQGRAPEDSSSFPVVLPQPVGGCNETVVFQLNGVLTAFCTENLDQLPVWTSKYSCTHRPAVCEVSNSIVCTTWATSVQHLDSDGDVIWFTDDITAVFTPVIADGIIWVIDNRTDLFGIQMSPPNPPTSSPSPGTPSPGGTPAPGTPAPTSTPSPGGPTSTPTPATPATPAPVTPAPGTPTPSSPSPQSSSGGLTGGQATGVALGVIIAIGVVAGAAFLYNRRKNRRRAYDQTLEDGAGMIVDEDRKVRGTTPMNAGGYGGVQ